MQYGDYYCEDTDWTDSYGDGCSWYDGYPESCGDYDWDGGSAWDNCCACGGGWWYYDDYAVALQEESEAPVQELTTDTEPDYY